ncbi:MAG: DUF3137 domain-containing protein [Candidatus Gracilibacteria bacterium]
MNTNINFGDLPNISEKLNASEIAEMNKVFNDPQVQQRLEEIEIQRITLQRWKYGIYGIIILSSIAGSIDTHFSQLFGIITLLGFAAYGFLQIKFSKLVNIPLKVDVLSKLCSVIYSKLLYSYDEKYSFNEINILRDKGILQSYDRIDSVEDSMEFDVDQNGKKMFVNAFEIKTSKMLEKRSYRHGHASRHRKRVVTNHAYLIKAVFPNARIPMKSDLVITNDQTLNRAIMIPFASGMTGFMIGALSFHYLSGLNLPGNTEILFALTIGCSLGLLMYKKMKMINEMNKVEMENIEFEKLFDVKCEDQVTSRMILTPAFMDRIVSFVHKTGNQYEFLFQGNTLYIKRKIPGKYLEVGTEKNILTNLSGFVQFYCDMREVMLFINDMNLMYLSKTDSSLVNISQEYHRSEALRFEKVSPLGFFAKFQPLLRFIR